MSERIGGVILNDDDYPGEDLYSDGAVEDELLGIAMNTDPADFDRVVASRKSWPVMYHFSTVRQNILSWFPVRDTDRVLEIGAGCGAVTRTLAARAGHVTCVDLSKKRSYVNAWRNRSFGNIEIRLGNFQDVEKKLGSDYDLITLIGVFEYGSGYIDSEQPYEDFLRIVGRHLAPGGRIVIAIENRLGLKYFAGCTEDHTGRFFDGIEGYPETDYVRTFSKAGLLRIFREAGFRNCEFRYPYPDYKFPMALYSDAYLPKRGELRNNMVNFDRRRMLLFDEAKAYDALLPEEYPLFSNSFFVTLSEEEIPGTGADFIKFSNDRSPRFSIRTDITAGGEPSVRKIAVCPEAEAHVRSMPEICRRLGDVFRGTRFEPNRCAGIIGDAAEFEFVRGGTLEEQMDSHLREPERLTELFGAFFREIDRTAGRDFRVTDGFTEVFGSEVPERPFMAPAVSDVDLIPSNVIADGDRWSVIDYEWTFPFPVPADYIKWRAVHYYTGSSGRSGADAGALLAKAGIRREDIPYFVKMEEHFQEYLARDAEPLWKLYPDVSEGFFRPSERGDGGYAGALSAAAYFDRGAGFTEEDTVRTPVPEDGNVRMDLVLDGVRELRIDPAERACAVVLSGISIDGRMLDPETVASNGFTADHRLFVLTGDDPQILTGPLPGGAKSASVSFRVITDPAEIRRKTEEVLRAKEERIRFLGERLSSEEETLERVGRAVDAIGHTRAEKLYRAARGAMGKTDPFDSVRPALVNGRDVHLVLDRRSYQPEGIYLMGWFFDPAYRGERLYLTDSDGKRLDVKTERLVREDVNGTLGTESDRFTGFNILVEYGQLERLPLFIVAENPRGILRLPLDIETDLEKREDLRAAVRRGESQVLVPLTTEYDEWRLDLLAEEGGTEERPAPSPGEGPLISVAVPLYRTPEPYLRELLDSLTAQTWEKIEICLADGSPDDSLGAFIRSAYPGESRIRYRHLHENLGISGNTNAALAMASGVFIALADHDDTLDPDACLEIARAAMMSKDTDIVYTDEDKLTVSGHFLFGPHFKPDYDPDYLCSGNYICHLFAVRRTLAAEAGPMRSEYDGAQDFDFILRCCERARVIRHVPRALYHWRAHPDSTAMSPESKMYAFENGRKAVEDHFRRTGTAAAVSMTEHPGHYRTRYEVPEEALVSILIPNRDQADTLRTCVNSILRKTSWKRFEILIIENGSTEEKTFRLYEELRALDPRVRVLTWDRPFNYAAVNNFAAGEAEGEYLLFLNNDTEVVSEDWIGEMAGFCGRPGTGCVGAYLEYPDGMIQHAGVIVGVGGAATHMFGGMDPADYPGGGRSLSQQDLSAVTGACMMTKRSVFAETGGFDERFEIAYNDIDYCLKVREKGLLVAVNVFAKLIHHESLSRGSDEASADRGRHERLMREAALLREKWPAIFRDGDPYYNPNLTRLRPDFSLRELPARGQAPGGAGITETDAK